MSRPERYLCGFDTEDPEGTGNPNLFTFCHEKGTYYTRDRWQALEFLLGLKGKTGRRRLECWCVNLEYDAMNLWGDERIAEVGLRFGKSALYGARWRGIEFRDTVRHIPASAAELGVLVHAPKLAQDFQSVEYAIRDAVIAYRTARLLYRIFGEFGERPRMTLPSTSYHIWESKFFGHRMRPPLSEIRDAAKLAYHGGRTEPFAIGTFDSVSVIDAASMFPWAMLAGPMPVIWGPFSRVGKGTELDALGLYDVTVTSDLQTPILPYRGANGTDYPNGKWRAWYTGEELIEFARLGGKVRVHQGFVYHTETRPFDDYIATMFERKQGARGARRSLYKLLLCSLYGKFGQGGERVRSMSLERFRELPAGKGPLDYRVWCGLVIWRENAPPPPWGNNLWAALITARARLRLHREIERLKEHGARPLYSDTDSVIYSGDGGQYPKKAVRPGDFEARGEYRRVQIVGKKEYGLEDKHGRWEIKIKGVPSPYREVYLREGKATFRKPTRMREASRLGTRANVWRDVTKQRRLNFKTRTVTQDGSLLPVIVTETA